MSKPIALDLRLFLVVGLCMLVGACASTPRTAFGESVVQTAATLNTIGPVSASKPPLLYLTDTNAYTIHIYPASERQHNPPPIQIINKGDDRPLGICVDRNGTVYEVNQGFTFENFSFVAEYPAGVSSPSTIITAGVKSPSACALDKSGTLFVSNNTRTQNGIPLVVIEEYAHGGTQPSGQLTIADPNPTGNADGCAGGMIFDPAGDLLVSEEFYTQSNREPQGHVYSFAPGATTAQDLGLKGIGDTCQSGVGVDGSGNLFVGSFNSASANIAVFGPGQTTPSRKITKGLTSPRLFSVDSAGRLYVPNYASPQQPQFANVVEYAPGGSTPVNTISANDFVSPVGTALTPGS